MQNFMFLVVTLSIEDNRKLSKLLCKAFKRSIYRNEYKAVENKVVEIADNNEKNTLENCFIQTERLSTLAYDNTNGHNKVF